MKHIWTGVGAAIIASIATAFIFERFTGGFDGRAEQIFEGLTLLFAVAILTVMTLWMGDQKHGITREIKTKTDMADKENGFGLLSLAFLSVYREGVEMVLFLKAAALSDGGKGELIGAILGLAMSAIVAIIIFKTSIKLNMTQFFKYSSFLLVFIAAGLLSTGIHELQEARWLPETIEHVWNLNGLISIRSHLGLFLKAIFGYNPTPSLLEAVGWGAYISLFDSMILWKKKRNER